MEKTGIAIYIRLSMADEDTGKGKDESNSIKNQRNLIHQFLDSHAELSGCPRTEFVDDGFTGTNTARPAFQNMIGQIREGRFHVCITKDFSRFSRDYIEIGDYLECVFPFLRVRYISINDGYDSEAYKGTTGGLEVVMRNIVYAAYSKDFSAKEVAGKRQSMKKGRRASGTPPYGYMPDPQRKSMNVVDPEAAKTVRKIFDLALEGLGAGKIAQRLNDEKMPTPSAYFRMKNPESDKFRNVSPNQNWNYSAVLNILRRYTYTGAAVGHQRKLTAPCSKSFVKVEKEEQIIVPGMHTPIVTEEEYELAQKIVKKTGRTRAPENEYPLKSLVYCGNCGRHMVRYHNRGRFRCAYGRSNRGSICSEVHSPLEADLEKIAFESIQNFINMADERQDGLKLAQTRQKDAAQSGIETSTVLRGRIESLKKEKLKVYEDYCAGKLDKESYICRKKEADEKIAGYEANIRENEERFKDWEQAMPAHYMELDVAISVYRDNECLTAEMAPLWRMEKIIFFSFYLTQSDFPLFECEEYHSFFQPLEVMRHTLLSDKMGFHFFELPKLPSDVGEDDMLLLWLSLFKAETEEELEKIKKMEVPIMSQAINAYYTITASSEFREKERLRAKARHDEAQALHNARREEKFDIAKKMLDMDMTSDQITKVTGLTQAEIESLRMPI